MVLKKYFILVWFLFSLVVNCSQIIVVTNGGNATEALNAADLPMNLVLLVKYENSSFLVDLHVNTMLMAETYTEKLITTSGPIEMKSDKSKNLCYYVGAVRHEEGSAAAFSFCNGFRGFFRVGKDTYHCSRTSKTFVVTKESDNKIASWYEEIASFKTRLLKSSGNRRRKRSLEDTALQDRLVVELYVVNDNAIYNDNDKDYNKVFSNTKEIVNNANLLYETTGIHVMLVGSEVWTDADRIEVSSVSAVTLENFFKYRFNHITTYNDNAYLITGKKYNNGVLGLARLGTMCSQLYSGGTLQGIKDRNDVSGAILAHEIGHNLGIAHNDPSCECESTNVGCIMNSHASITNPGVYFSSCSKQKLDNLANVGFDICLHNQPNTLNQYQAVCNNGILEEGEECDCGRLPSHLCNKACCQDCKLTSGASCAHGKCCDVGRCSLKAVNTVCRQASSQCDIEERCDGRSSLCPADVTAQQGLACNENNNKGYCFDGVCQSKDSHCKVLYGSEAKEGNSGCYEFNTVGTVHGFCEKSFKFNSTIETDYTACSQRQKLCGVLQCDALPANLVKPYNYRAISQKSYNAHNCVNIVFDVGSDVRDPSLVPNGSPCGEDMLCYNKLCMPASNVQMTFSCGQCLNGKCGSDGLCHCNVGYQGSSCESLSSETPSTTTSTTTTTTSTTTSTTTTSTTTTTTSTTTSTSTTISSTMGPVSPIITTKPTNITSSDEHNNNNFKPEYTAIIIIIILILLLIPALVYAFIHREQIESYFKNKKEKVAAASVKVREIKNADDKKRLSNHAFEEDHSYITMPQDNQNVYANQNEMNSTRTYSYEQPSPMIDIINANLKTPPSGYPPSLIKNLDSNNYTKLIAASRDSMWPVDSTKPPVPDASLKPSHSEYEVDNHYYKPFDERSQYNTNSEYSNNSDSLQTPSSSTDVPISGLTDVPISIKRPNKLALRRDMSSPSNTKSPVFDGQLQLHLTELNNNPTFSKIKEKLNKKESVA